MFDNVLRNSLPSYVSRVICYAKMEVRPKVYQLTIEFNIHLRTDRLVLKKDIQLLAYHI